jgi:dTDP-glucose 4,6-dehydratase
MKKVLVTGGCGFIGSNFIRYLLAAADFTGEVINLDRLTYAANPDNLAGIDRQYAGRYHFVQADICDPAAVANVFDRFDIDTVCHFAAESHVDRSIVAPDAFIQANVIGTFTLLNQARLRGERLTLFHHVSTDEVFGSLGDQGAFTEETPYRPNSPYSASKAASDHLVRAYGHTYGLPVTISNCSNNYGPYQFPEKLVPLVLLNALDDKPLPVYGDGSNIRDWLYVTDHCRAVWEIMKRGRRGESYNIGGRCERRNLEVVQLLCDLLDEIRPRPTGGRRRELITFVKDRPGHDFRYAIDFTRIHRELGWEPTETFETGLRRTIGWYLDNPAWVRRVRSGAYRDWMQQQYAQ